MKKISKVNGPRADSRSQTNKFKHVGGGAARAEAMSPHVSKGARAMSMGVPGG